MFKIGILALQGAFAEHGKMIASLGHLPAEVRLPSDLNDIDGLILPGGESTSMSKLLDAFELRAPIKRALESGLPCLGTCAGMILLSKEVEDSSILPLGIMDITVRRNAYGRQLSSFVTEGVILAFGSAKIPMVFIRAPIVTDISESVEPLYLISNQLVAVRQKNIMALSFHPELTDSPTIHSAFIHMIAAYKAKN